MSARRTRASARSEPTARPHQPTDSPAASLPNETLAQILELSLEHMTLWDKQRAKINFGKVCYTWYGVALPLRDCVVPDSNRAQSLAAVLKRGRMESDRSGVWTSRWKLLAVVEDPRLPSFSASARPIFSTSASTSAMIPFSPRLALFLPRDHWESR